MWRKRGSKHVDVIGWERTLDVEEFRMNCVTGSVGLSRYWTWSVIAKGLVFVKGVVISTKNNLISVIRTDSFF
jgi:hypothetical protein